MKTSVRDELEQALRRRRGEVLRAAAEHEVELRAIAAEPDSELGERAQDEQLDQVLARLDDRERREIGDINAALDRIADGTYGRCARCGAAIETDRLAVLPATSLCANCAIALEGAP
jgi:RNA polymerase-binding protein DksA